MKLYLRKNAILQVLRSQSVQQNPQISVPVEHLSLWLIKPHEQALLPDSLKVTNIPQNIHLLYARPLPHIKFITSHISSEWMWNRIGERKAGLNYKTVVLIKVVIGFNISNVHGRNGWYIIHITNPIFRWLLILQDKFVISRWQAFIMRFTRHPLWHLSTQLSTHI